MQDRGLYERILGLPDPWHVTDVELRDEAREVVVDVALRGSPVLTCPECGTPMTAYDHRTRRWRHLDTCQYKTIIKARVPRGRCPSHGVRQVTVPWAEMHSRFTALFEALVIDWLRETSQQAVARRIGMTWAEVHGIMERAVRRGLARRGEEQIEYLGVDEKSFQKGHEYVTVVCDLCKPARVLAVGDGRGRASLDEFYKGLKEDQRSGIQGVAMDMWGPYISSTLEHVPGAADKIVFDKFHIVAHLKKAVDDVRKAEHRRLRALGDETLTGTKYVWLKGKRRFDRGAWVEFGALRNSDLHTARAWSIVEMFSRFWSYVSPAWAQKLFDRWYAWAIRSRLEPIKRVARMIKAHLPNVLTYLRHRITNAATEGINSKIQWIKATGRGFTNRENFRIAILFHCGGLDLHPHTFL